MDEDWNSKNLHIACNSKKQKTKKIPSIPLLKVFPIQPLQNHWKLISTKFVLGNFARYLHEVTENQSARNSQINPMNKSSFWKNKIILKKLPSIVYDVSKMTSLIIDDFLMMIHRRLHVIKTYKLKSSQSSTWWKLFGIDYTSKLFSPMWKNKKVNKQINKWINK